MKVRTVIISLLAVMVVPALASAAVINWGPAQDTAAPANIRTGGSLFEAINATNSNSGSVTVNGVVFANSDALLPNSTGTDTLAGANTGDAGLNSLLGRLDFGGGTSTSVNVGGGGLVPGHDYELQVFYTDLRSCCNTRDMTYGDGLGGNVNVNASGGAGAFGQFAVGSFNADAGSQTLSMVTNGFGNAHINAYQIRDVTGVTALIDDDFENGDLATGGINGGFRLVTNSAGGTPSASEAGGKATTVTAGNNDNTGIVSINSFNASGQPNGFKMTFEVDSMSADPQANGMFLGLQDDASTFFRDTALDHNFGMAFSGNESRTNSGGGFGLVTNDISNPGSAGNGVIFDDGDLQLTSLQDGFVAMITATPDGWAYELTGVNDTAGNPTAFSNSGKWTDAGLPATFYNDFFDDAEHLAAYVQRGGGGNPNITTMYGRIAVESVTAVPEPATALLGLISLAAAGLRRRRRAD